jgi:hypothetical protein
MADIKITVDSSEIKRATQHTTELEGATTRFGTKLDPLLKKEKAFAKAVKQVNDAMRLGVATQKQAIAEIERLGRAYGQTQAQIDRTTASMTGIRKNTNRMNATIQNAGYQFGDFFVQVQSGQNALVAFSQQGAQLAGLLPGIAGAITGVALVLTSSLARALMESAGLAGSLKERFEAAKISVDELTSSFSSFSDAVENEANKAVREFIELRLQKDLQEAADNAAQTLRDLETSFRTTGEGFTLFRRYGQEMSEAAQPIQEIFNTLQNPDFTNLESLEKTLQAVNRLIFDFSDELGISKDEMKELEGFAESLTGAIEELPRYLETVSGETKKAKDELKEQKDLLTEIVKLEEARDRLGKSLEQKFADSTRRLELLKSGMSPSLAGKTVSMENLIAEAVAGERAYQSQLMNPLQLQKYMGEYEKALSVRLEGYTAEQIEAAELLRIRKDLEKETKPESIYGQAIGPVKPEPSSRAGFDITPAAEENRKQIERQIELAGLLSDSFVGAFRDIANGTETASDAFKKMTIAIIQHIMDVLIFKPLIESLTNALSPTAGAGSGLLGALFPAANGAAIDNGNVVPFAYGGVVNSPTMFGMSGGRTGLMGEAGPEAILPLKRGAGGKLGVEGGGNVTVHQSFNFAANGDESVKRIIAEAAPGIAKMTEAQIVNSRQRGGQMRRVFS